MPEENTATGIAVAPEQPTTGTQGTQAEQPETKSEQPSEAKSDLFSDREKLEKSYKELQGQFTKVTQEFSEVRKDAEALKFLRSDPKFVEWATNTYGEKQQKPQASVPEDDNEEIITTKGELRKLMADEAKRVLESDPLRRYVQETAVETEINKVERKGYSDVRQYRPEISDWLEKHPDSNLPLEDVYKIVAFEKKAKTGTETNATLKEKKASSSEGPGMTVVKTEQPVTSIRDAALAAFKKLGRDTSNL